MTETERLKVLATALLLTRRDVARAATIGGIPTSNNRAASWLRSDISTKPEPGKYGESRYRAVEISADELDAVLLGLKTVLSEIDADANQDVDRENRE